MFSVVKPIGHGGFGVVDHVVDEFGNHCARKTFHPAARHSAALIDNARKRFIREARLQSGVRHKNIVRVLSVDVSSDPPSFLMPLADASLADEFVKDRAIAGNVQTALMDIMAALEEIHSMEIFHRDLKPGNVLRFTEQFPSGPQAFYAISDFGLMSYHATQLSTLTTTDMAMGTGMYTAPEIVRELKQATAQSDIYALGCIIHDFFSVQPRVPCGEIRESSSYGSILLNCTRKDPKRRFKSVADVRDALLSVGVGTVAPSADAAQLAALLQGPDPISKEQWQAIADFLETHAGAPDVSSLLMRMSLERIRQLCETDIDAAKSIAIHYANWVRDGWFVFSECDAVSDRACRMAELLDINAKAEALMALLYMGTGHNRWYVEKRFFERVVPTMEDALARRLSVEFRADKERVCRAVSLMESSIGVTRSAMHPLLVQTLNEICK